MVQHLILLVPRFSAIRSQPLLLIILVVVGFGILWLISPYQVTETVLAPRDEGSRYFFGGTQVVGQQFIARPGLHRLHIPVGVSGQLPGPLLLHLRETWTGPDLRTDVVFAVRNEVAEFSFHPLAARHEQNLLWILESPHAAPKTFWVDYEQDSTAYSGGRAIFNTKEIPGNFAFTMTRTISRAVAFFLSSEADQTWHVSNIKRWEWGSMIAAAILTVLIFVAGKLTRHQPVSRLIVLLSLLAFAAHGSMALVLPLNNDEGAYMQDAVQTTTDFWPFRDFLTKGPAYVAALKVWQLLTPNTILAWRLFSALAWSGAVYAAWRLVAELGFGRRAQLLTGLLLALSPATIALTTPLLLQVASVPAVAAGLCVCARAARSNQARLAALAAVIMTLACFIRITSVVGALLGALLLLYYAQSRWRLLRAYVAVGLGCILLAWLVSVTVIGSRHTAVLFNVEALLIAQQRASITATSAAEEPLIRQVVFEARVLWRLTPLLLAGLFLWPVFLVKRYTLPWAITVLTLLAVLMYQIVFHLRDGGYLLPSFFLTVAVSMMSVFVGLPLVALVIQILTTPASRQRTTRPLPVLVGALLWLVLLVVIYGYWGRFRQNYLVEFLVPLTLLAAWGMSELWARTFQIVPQWLGRALRVTLLGVISWSLCQGAYVAHRYPHTGTMATASVREAARVVAQYLPPGEPLFTAQPAVTALAGRPIMFGYAHPGWYREERFQTISSELRALFFRPPAAVTAYLAEQARFVLMERRTWEIYFDGYPERQALLDRHFTLVATVPNDAGGDDFQLYERRPPASR